MNRMNVIPRFVSIAWSIMGPVVLLLSSGLIPAPSGVYPPTDYGDMAFGALLTLAGWAVEGPLLVRWVRRKLGWVGRNG